MSFWRLHIRPEKGQAETRDLKGFGSAFSVGYSPKNDFAISSVAVPNTHRLLWRGPKHLYLRLTEELSGDLSGEAYKVKSWAARLYRGEIYRVEGPTSWTIGNIKFDLEQVEPVAVSPAASSIDPMEVKHSIQSFVATLAAHALLVLLFVGASYLSRLFHKDIDLTQYQVAHISIQQAKEVFKKKVVEVPAEEELSKLIEKELIPAEPAPSKALAPAKSTAPAKAKAGSLKPAAVTNVKKIDVTQMGLLAIQSTRGPSTVALSTVQPRVIDAKPFNEKMQMGIASADFGVGTGGDASVGLVKLSSLSAKGYEGDLGEKIQRASANGDGQGRIRLVRKEVEVRGGLDPAIIRQIIEERLPEIRYCFEKALLEQSNLKGKISATWTITSEGSVTSIASTSEDIQPQVLHPCVRQQIQGWKFPQPKGGGVVHVKYPFVFNPTGS